MGIKQTDGEAKIPEDIYRLVENGNVKEAEKQVRSNQNLRKIRFQRDAFILTPEEAARREEEEQKRILQQTRALYLVEIRGHGLSATIDRQKRKVEFQYKDWPRYIIDTTMKYSYRRIIAPREEEIVRNCAEARLHYKWIAEILGTSDKVVYRMCQRLWIKNVFLTPQKSMRTVPIITVFDADGFFLIDKENPQFGK